MENINNISWKVIGETKQALNQALDATDLGNWEIKELTLIQKGGHNITNECRVIKKPDGTIEIVC